MKTISERIRQAYMHANYEHNRLVEYDDMDALPEMRSVKYCDLPLTNVDGFPYASRRNDKGELEFFFSPNAHEICVGTTGSGKTTGCIEPRIRVLASRRNKPSFFITDPKGEIFERNAGYLSKCGYRLFALNFKDCMHSDRWNVLGEIYDSWMRIRDNAPIPSPANEPNGNDGRFEFNGITYSSADEVKAAYSVFEGLCKAETDDLISQLVCSVCTVNLSIIHDPSWYMGAQEILRGMIYLLLEEAITPDTRFTRDMMSFSSIQECYLSIRTHIYSGSGMRSLQTMQWLSNKPYNSESLKHLRPFLENAPQTTKSYMGVFENMMQNWFSVKISTLCNGNSIDIDAFRDKPLAIFLVTRDYEKSDFTVAGLFIDWVYRVMLRLSEEEGGALSRDMYFMLDEFGNIPAIKDFENKIATARSRNIWFNIIVQSYSQLSMVYGAEVACVIRDNCNSHMFLGSQNYNTKLEFARECGKHAIPSLGAMLDPCDNGIVEVPLVHVSDLESLGAGHMYVKKYGMPIICSKMERSYNCPGLLDGREINVTIPQAQLKPYSDRSFVFEPTPGASRLQKE